MPFFSVAARITVHLGRVHLALPPAVPAIGSGLSMFGVVLPLLLSVFPLASNVALFSQFASSSSVLATPSPPMSGKFWGTCAELLDLFLPPNESLSASLDSLLALCSSPPDALEEALLNRLNLLMRPPRGSGERRGP